MEAGGGIEPPYEDLQSARALFSIILSLSIKL